MLLIYLKNQNVLRNKMIGIVGRVIVMLLFMMNRAYAQTDINTSVSKKDVQNLENVSEDTFRGNVFYDQRLSRNPFKAMYVVHKLYPSQSVTPLFQGMPIGKYQLDSLGIHYSPLTKEERTEYFSNSKLLLHPRRYKLDFWIQPLFTATFGNFSKPVQSLTSVALQTQFFIWPGLSLNLGILFPIVNDLDNRPNIIRPAPIYLNQFYASGNNYFSLTAGMFYTDQYGVNLQYRHADFQKPWSFGVEGGLTGAYYYPRGGIYAAVPDQLLLLGDVAYKFKKQDVTLKVSGGQFLWKDKGVRVDFVRQFTNVEVAIYASKTQNGSTVGFNFAIPIPPGRIAQGKKARLRTVDEFRWEYTYTRGYRIGERYRLGYQLDQKLRQYHIDYINSQIYLK